jgi:hypothetical protein
VADIKEVIMFKNLENIKLNFRISMYCCSINLENIKLNFRISM